MMVMMMTCLDQRGKGGWKRGSNLELGGPCVAGDIIYYGVFLSFILCDCIGLDWWCCYSRLRGLLRYGICVMFYPLA